MKLLLPLLFTAVASLPVASAQPDGSAVLDRSASLATLKNAAAEIHASGLSPEEQVARMVAMREAQMKLLPAPSAQTVPDAAAMSAPRTQQEENIAALRQTRASARTPEEEVTLVSELFRINALAYTLPASQGDRQSLQAARFALKGQNGPVAESRDAILELLATARSPEESVQLMQQFLTLNREALISLVAPQSVSATLQSK